MQLCQHAAKQAVTSLGSCSTLPIGMHTHLQTLMHQMHLQMQLLVPQAIDSNYNLTGLQ